jgi:ATP-dependent helicase/nuclease subunit B
MDSSTARTVLTEGHAPALLAALAAAAAAHPVERKLLVCRRLGEGRELLRWLSLAGVPWVGFEPTTPRQLATLVVARRLTEVGLRAADEFDELALLDAALDEVLAEGGGPRLRELAEGAGFRDAVANAVMALRLAGIDAETLGRVPLRDLEKRSALVGILDAYERRLSAERLVDGARVLRLANQELRAGAAELPAARLLIAPGHDRRGLTGRLLELLVERGAAVLPSEGIVGLARPAARLAGDASDSAGSADVPEPTEGGVGHDPAASVAPSAGEPMSGAPARSTLAYLHDVASLVAAEGGARQAPEHTAAEVAVFSDEGAARKAPGRAVVEPALFAAASLTDELREVLRRVVSAGLRWDEVEIVATEPIAYGAALDGLTQRLGIPVTFALGLPLDRTRPGRALRGWLRWIREDFPEDVIRGLIERGDVAPPGAGGSDGAALARQLRGLRIGRGRDRYAAALDHAERTLDRPIRADERTAQDVAAERAQKRAGIAALRAILLPILEATPALPDRLGLRSTAVSAAELARAARAFLALVPEGAPIDAHARDSIQRRLTRLEATATRATSLDAAVAVLASRLDTRVPAADAEGRAPWTAAGGRLHLSDVESGGYTGRRATFVVGLDAARFPGYGVQDPLLIDEDRHRLNTGQSVGALPKSGDRIAERRYALAELLARLRGDVTLSYSAWEAAEARTLPPASELLQAFRLRTRDPAADYDRMHGALGVVASSLPHGAARLDRADVWLGALDAGGVMREGRHAVEAGFVGLGRGVRAREHAHAPTLGRFQGGLAIRPIYDPRDNPDVIVSSTRLERLGACPRRYLLHDVLRVRPPDDPELEPDRWLSPRDRGSLLHTVFERALRRVRDAGAALDDAIFLDGALHVLDEEMADWRERLPAAGEAVYAVEAERLRDDVRAFVRVVRRDQPDWLDLERTFGRDGEPPVAVRLPGGTIRMAGAIDRIDRTDDGLVVIDYKTGGTYGYQRNTGIYRGGRRLQHVLYAAIAEQLYGAAVVRAEYHFPTVKGGADRAAYTADELREGLTRVDELLSIAARGHFHPTDDPQDCRFCDYATVCRVRLEGSRVVSPAATWVKAAHEVEELSVLRALREDP